MILFRDGKRVGAKGIRVEDRTVSMKEKGITIAALSTQKNKIKKGLVNIEGLRNMKVILSIYNNEANGGSLFVGLPS